MNPAGAILVVLGIWISTQVWGGNALQRLNIVKDDGSAKAKPPASGFDNGHSGGGANGGGGGSF